MNKHTFFFLDQPCGTLDTTTKVYDGRYTYNEITMMFTKGAQSVRNACNCKIIIPSKY